MFENKCPHCEENEAESSHSCPFAAEIHGDESEDYCTCCEDCEDQCRWDI